MRIYAGSTRPSSRAAVDRTSTADHRSVTGVFTCAHWSEPRAAVPSGSATCPSVAASVPCACPLQSAVHGRSAAPESRRDDRPVAAEEACPLSPWTDRAAPQSRPNAPVTIMALLRRWRRVGNEVGVTVAARMVRWRDGTAERGQPTTLPRRERPSWGTATKNKHAVCRGENCYLCVYRCGCFRVSMCARAVFAV